MPSWARQQSRVSGRFVKITNFDGAAVLSDENLVVREALNIAFQYQWGPERSVHRSVICCTQPSFDSDGKRILNVSESFDWFDEGLAVGQILFEQPPRLEDVLVIATLLETPLDKLYARGYPVDAGLLESSSALEQVEQSEERENGGGGADSPVDPAFATAEAVVTVAAAVGEQLGGAVNQVGHSLLDAASSVTASSTSWFGSSMAAFQMPFSLPKNKRPPWRPKAS